MALTSLGAALEIWSDSDKLTPKHTGAQLVGFSQYLFNLFKWFGYLKLYKAIIAL